FLASTPFFSDTTCVQIGCLFQFRQSPADGLGIALQHAGDVPDPTMPQLRGLDGGIPPTIVFDQRVVQALHHPFDSRCIGVHAALLPLVALQSKDLISYSLKIRKLFSSRSSARFTVELQTRRDVLSFSRGERGEPRLRGRAGTAG